MTERPIMFSGPMVRAILDGKKTQTRRMVGLDTLRPSETPGYDWTFRGQAPIRSIAQQRKHPGGCWQDVTAERLLSLCPYGISGDRLWVREAFQIGYDAGRAGRGRRWSILQPTGSTERDGRPFYRATFKEPDPDKHGTMVWRSPIHMPRWASRIDLKVTDVRVDRLQNISEEDAINEGVDAIPVADVPRQATWSRRQDFAQLWDQINADRGSWANNPWVWVIEFSVAERSERLQ